MVHIRIDDQNLVCVANLKVTTNITAVYIITPTNQKPVSQPVAFTALSPSIWKANTVNIVAYIIPSTSHAK